MSNIEHIVVGVSPKQFFTFREGDTAFTLQWSSNSSGQFLLLTELKTGGARRSIFIPVILNFSPIFSSPLCVIFPLTEIPKGLGFFLSSVLPWKPWTTSAKVLECWTSAPEEWIWDHLLPLHIERDSTLFLVQGQKPSSRISPFLLV